MPLAAKAPGPAVDEATVERAGRLVLKALEQVLPLAPVGAVHPGRLHPVGGDQRGAQRGRRGGVHPRQPGAPGRLDRGDDQGRATVRRVTFTVDVEAFAGEMWRKTLRDKRRPGMLACRHLEVCVFSHLAAELRSGDIAVVGSDSYANLHAQLMTW